MPDKLVSATVFGTSWYGNNYDPKIAEYVDWLGVMTYDFTGSWKDTPVGPHTALSKIRNQDAYAGEQQGKWPGNGPADNPIFSVEDSIWYWTNPLFANWEGRIGQSVPRNKMVAGVPLYGIDFAYAKDRDAHSHQVPPGYRVILYKDILSDKDILSQFPDAHTAANANIKVSGSTPRPPFVSAPGNYPYAHNIYFETLDTAVAKLNFLKGVGVQGVLIWELSSDIWEEGKSIVKALYKNSGNPAIKPPLPSTLKPLSRLRLIGVFSGELSAPQLIVSETSTTPFGTSGPPAVAVYNGKLFCVHEGSGRDGWLWYCTLEPFFRSSIVPLSTKAGKWSEDTRLNFGTSGPPALAVYDGKLFCVHQGGRGDGWLWCCTFENGKWSEDTKLNVGVGSRRHSFSASTRDKMVTCGAALFTKTLNGLKIGW